MIGDEIQRDEEGRKVSPKAGHGEWQLVGAVLGHEDIVVGPSPRDPAHEALALVPPGVRIPAPQDSESRVSTEGWRVALWSASGNGERHIDVGPPIYLCPVPLAFVLGLVEAECPDLLCWLADRLTLLIVNACAVQRRDCSGNSFSFGDRWRNAAEATLDELDIALAHVAPGDQRPGSASQDGEYAHVGSDLSIAHPCIQQPGRFDERLREGRLRQLYEHLSRASLESASGAG